MAVCTNLSCYLRGAEDIYEAVCRRAGARAGEVSADGRWSVERAECLGSCGTAPSMLVDEEMHEGLTPQSVERVLGGLK